MKRQLNEKQQSMKKKLIEVCNGEKKKLEITIKIEYMKGMVFPRLVME